MNHRRSLILASQSKVRSIILKNMGVSHECIPADVDEKAIKKKEKK